MRSSFHDSSGDSEDRSRKGDRSEFYYSWGPKVLCQDRDLGLWYKLCLKAPGTYNKPEVLRVHQNLGASFLDSKNITLHLRYPSLPIAGRQAH